MLKYLERYFINPSSYINYYTHYNKIIIIYNKKEDKWCVIFWAIEWKYYKQKYLVFSLNKSILKKMIKEIKKKNLDFTEKILYLKNIDDTYIWSDIYINSLKIDWYRIYWLPDKDWNWRTWWNMSTEEAVALNEINSKYRYIIKEIYNIIYNIYYINNYKMKHTLFLDDNSLIIKNLFSREYNTFFNLMEQNEYFDIIEDEYIKDIKIKKKLVSKIEKEIYKKYWLTFDSINNIIWI